ncbi:N-succinylarginine dihydrolase [Dirofilaria immitis]
MRRIGQWPYELLHHPALWPKEGRGEDRIMRNNWEIRNDGKMILKHNAGIIIGTQPTEIHDNDSESLRQNQLRRDSYCHYLDKI